MIKIDDSYLEDEIRDGFYIPSMTKRTWAMELTVLDLIDSICSKHNITYFADWGTYLGAIRHKGFVPWDDDLDICMHRNELNKFLAVAKEELPEGYSIMSFHNNDYSWKFIYNIVPNDHMCFTPEYLKSHYSFPYIVAIDIFIIDNISDDDSIEQSRNEQVKRLLNEADGGLLNALDGLARVSDETVSTTPGIFASFLGPDPLNLMFVVILTSLGTWGLPQMVQKFYAIKDEGSIHKGTVISTIFALVVAGGCYFLGGFGRLYSDQIDIAANGYDSVIPTMLQNLSPGLIALVVILVLSASMSTLSSLVIASSSTLTIDFLKGKFMKKMDDKQQLLSIRILVVVFIAISAIIALIQYKSSVTFIAQLMGISWGALAGAFLAPFLYSLYWKKTTKIACWASFVFGVGLMMVNMFAKSVLPKLLQSPINSGAIAMLAGLVIVPVVSLITKAPDNDFVEETFACYEKKHEVSQKTALND